MRLADNRALSSALGAADSVVPVYVLDPHLLESNHASRKRIGFLMAGLRLLDADLRERGSRLVVRRGEPTDQLGALVADTRSHLVVAEEDYTGYAHRRDDAVAEQLPLELVQGSTVIPPGGLLKADGTPYVVFTPFSRAWKALVPPSRADLVPAPKRLTPPPELFSEPIPSEPQNPAGATFVPGEAEAVRRLDQFAVESTGPDARTRGVFAYADLRDRIDLEATSGLSPYLRFGMVSPRAAAVAALEAAVRTTDTGPLLGAETWLNELIWREFYAHILDQFPHVSHTSFRSDLRHVEWSNDIAEFEAWKEGRTGYPIVDAAMRQLSATGWMHNRARMIVASFLVKDLLIDWRWGERYFMEHLLDGDPASNNGGWQWSAGTGTDAAPYFRVFNPVLQGRKSDPHGAFVRRWLPELTDVPVEFIHAPWEMPGAVQVSCGCRVGRDYPQPIVDHATARRRALDAYAAAREAGAIGKRS